MPDRHVRAAGEVMGRLSHNARLEVCRAIGDTTAILADVAIRRLEKGDVDGGWRHVNEARALTQFDQYCRGYGRKHHTRSRRRGRGRRY